VDSKDDGPETENPNMIKQTILVALEKPPFSSMQNLLKRTCVLPSMVHR
jgi:hypothetical protein